jgi:hypothetical protein
MIRPPKPLERASSPRHKKGEKPRTAITALQALQHLIDEQPTHDHLLDFMAETNSEKNDRGAAILMATNVENALQGAIVELLVAARIKGLFRAEGALGSFANKVQMAYAMDIFGDETKANLDIVRIVRNAFAHAKIPIKFDTIQVKEACSHLVIPKSLPPTTLRPPQPHIEGRKLFQEVCNTTAHNLSMVSIGARHRIPREKISLRFELPENYEISARRQALP